MWLKKMKNKQSITITLIIIAIMFWLLNYFTPEYNDDYFYKFIFDGNDANVNMPITSYEDILISQYNHYFNMNGRSIVHVIVQLFSGIWGKSVFNVVNTFVFVAFVYVITRLYIKIITSSYLLFSCCIIFLLYPWICGMTLWMTGSINYMWVSLVVCMFLLIIDKYKNNVTTAKHYVWGFLFIFVGWSHEGVTCPMALSLFIYILFKYKTIYKQAVFPMMIGFIIGALLCSLAPGTLHRASIGNGINTSSFMQKIISGFTVCSQLKAVYFLLCSIITMCVIKRNCALWIKEFYRNNVIPFNTLLFSFGIVFLSGFITIGPAIGVELFSIVLFLRIIINGNRSFVKYLKVFVYLISCILYCSIVYYSSINFKEFNEVKMQLNNRTSNIILTHKTPIPSYMKSYVLTNYDAGFLYNDYWNLLIAATYNYDSLAFVPTMVYDDIISCNTKINDIQQQEDYPFYVIPINNNNTDSIHPIFILKPIDFQQLPFYIRPFFSKMLRYTATEIPASQYGIVNIKEQDYLFISKNKMIDGRVRTIALQ